ncbi:TetR/AcrR family transcriptional regulator [Vibrio sp. 404]|uniref:TetR/AcrR family transcriptional regulator n=1 Tax=Vibrio marinisediminis TaxID=2758441 RepID=A0A7W2FNK0_9VIBR|nr:TetR/AcrR family transcriptional regulator [Vibrio marinisediminis]MBA5761328.1 TetR/AcrR family transcriptional regulator [Vibrio marinisediminis]
MSKGRLTREAILATAFELASKNGLESLTIGELAKQCSMSKSGLFAHFNSKENLQLSVLGHANHVFAERVIEPARSLGDENIIDKFKALLDHWLGWNHSFQGSCMFLDAWKETSSSEQTLIQQQLKATILKWIDYLTIQLRKGRDNQQFRADLDCEQAAFELYGLYLSAHLFYSLRGEQASQAHFWQGVDRLLADWTTP